jgi:hypothetical protein
MSDLKSTLFEGSSFPLDTYTPYGYLDNRFHSWALNPSGVIRSDVKGLGFDIWHPCQWQQYYIVGLIVGANVDNKLLLLRDDFERGGLSVFSGYHSSRIMSYDWSYGELIFHYVFFQTSEDSVSALVEISNRGNVDKIADIFALGRYEIGNIGYWGGDGVNGQYLTTVDAIALRSWAASGTVLTIKANISSVGHHVGGIDSIRSWITGSTGTKDNDYVYAPGPLYAILSYELNVPKNSSERIVMVMARGANLDFSLRSLNKALENWNQVFEEKLSEDNKFWDGASMLYGDWPEYWKRGWVTDMETQRIISRPPIGIYKYHWDAMQIQMPRVVIAETTIDALTLSYADMDLAKEEIYGLFADALSPQVPCSREDGSVNMVAADGSECGTGPQWCFPFHSIHSIFLRTGDKEWLGKLYPYMKAYLDWWLANRTDDEGWIVFKCSWESGQDASRRFLIQQKTGGELTDFVRTVDGQASMAEACHYMSEYAEWLGLGPSEVARWRSLAENYINKTRSLYKDGWFRDFDKRSGMLIEIRDYYDVMMVSPIMCNAASDDQIFEVLDMLNYYDRNPAFWLEWPSFVYVFGESSWYATLRALQTGYEWGGRALIEKNFLSNALYKVIERVYTNWDSRKMIGDHIPGVSWEFWPLQGAGGSECYGWGATLPIHIIRDIIGFREEPNSQDDVFVLAPSLPDRLMIEDSVYGIRNLSFRGVGLDISVRVLNGSRLCIEIHTDKARSISISNYITGERIAFGPREGVTFEAENTDAFLVEMTP